MVYAESDGFRFIDAFVNVTVPKAGYEVLKTAIVIKINEQNGIPLKVWIEDPTKRLGEAIWCDEEYVSIKYPDTGGYMIWKRAELGLLKREGRQ